MISERRARVMLDQYMPAATISKAAVEIHTASSAVASKRYLRV
jgi:hypothetical protein